MKVYHNASAHNTHRNLIGRYKVSNRASHRLSTGMRINNASDDAAGLAVSEGMRNQIRGIGQGVRNTQDGISLIQTAEGALEEVHRILERTRVLVNQAANGTYDSGDRLLILAEIEHLMEELEVIYQNSYFNGIPLLRNQMEELGLLGSLMPLFDIGNVITAVTPGLGIMGGISTWTGINAGARPEVDFTPDNGVSVSARTALLDLVPANQQISVFNINVGEGESFAVRYFFPQLLAPAAAGSMLILTAPDGTIFQSDANSFTTDNLNNSLALGIFEQTQVSTWGFEVHGAQGGGVGTWNVSIYRAAGATSMTHQVSVTGIAGTWGEEEEELNPIDPPLETPEPLPPSRPNLPPPQGNLWIQSGANARQGKYINLQDVSREAMGIHELETDFYRYATQGSSGLEISMLLDRLDEAINFVSVHRANLGAYQNRLEHTLNNNRVAKENVTAANSRIRDADMALEAMNLAQNQVLTQAALSMVAQANHDSERVLQLIRW